MAWPSERPGSIAPLAAFRCESCGYGAVRRTSPHRCPMCGGTSFEEQARRPYAALVDELDEAGAEDAVAPAQREAIEIDAGSVLPGVPFS